MKHLEELSRQHVEEAIQAGLRSQSAHRARFEHIHPAATATPQKARRLDPQLSAQPSWFTLLIYRFLKFGG